MDGLLTRLRFNMKYLMEGTEDHSNITRFKIVNGAESATWRALQEQHDPMYILSYLKFYPLGPVVKHVSDTND